MRISPFLISLLLFALPLVAGQSLAPWFSKLVAYQLLEQKVSEIETAMEVRYKELDENIRTQLALLAFDCGPKDMELLRDNRFYSRHIRIQGLKLASGIGCSSLGPDVSFVTTALPPYPEQDQFGLAPTSSSFNTEQEVIAYVHTAGNTAYWVLNNSWSYDLLQRPCHNCFYLEFGPHKQDLNNTYFPRGDRTIKLEPGSQSINFKSPDRNIQLTLWAGKALRRYGEQQAHHYGLWLGFILGVVMVALYWLQRNYQRSLKGLLQAGLTRREFIPFYQPVVDSRTHQVVGYEALLRWQRGHELVPPGTFIAYAEEQGLILPMTEQLLEQVIRDLPTLAPTQWVSVNLVATHIEQPLLRNLLSKHHNPSPDQLTFELTERNPINDIQSAIAEISSLQQEGYHFKLDDFGTGYGGFAYLQRLGIRQIKIDKMFVDTIGTHDLKRGVLDAIIAFGRESDMEMIAEGVETQEQVDYLAQRGVYLIQGYVFAKPMPLAALSRWEPELREQCKGKKA